MGIREVQELKEQKEKLAKAEANTVPGASLMSPKQNLLNASDVEAAHPDMRVRWLNTKNAEKVITRQAEGYVRLSETEGGRSLGGEMALFAIPKAQHEARVKRQEQMNQDRLVQHERDAERMADAIARELRDKHGISVSPDKLMSPKVGN